MNHRYLSVIATTGIVPVRASNDEAGEQVTQMLLGEMAEVYAITGEWVHVQLRADSYEGWVSRSQIAFLKSEEEGRLVTGLQPIRWPWSLSCHHYGKAGRAVSIPLGARLFHDGSSYRLWDGSRIDIPDREPLKKDDVISTAESLLGVSYQWGGRSDAGVDCSGLIQLVYQLHGLQIPRNSGTQAVAKAFTTHNIKDAKRGDSVYFAFGAEQPITHVGLHLGGGAILHASGSVKIDNIDPDKRFESQYPFNQKLADAIAGIQTPFVEREVEPAGVSALS